MSHDTKKKKKKKKKNDCTTSEDSDQFGHPPSATHWAHSEDSDQTGLMPRLIWVFAWRTLILLVLSYRGSYYLIWHTIKNDLCILVDPVMKYLFCWNSVSIILFSQLTVVGVSFTVTGSDVVQWLSCWPNIARVTGSVLWSFEWVYKPKSRLHNLAGERQSKPILRSLDIKCKCLIVTLPSYGIITETILVHKRGFIT